MGIDSQLCSRSLVPRSCCRSPSRSPPPFLAARLWMSSASPSFASFFLDSQDIADYSFILVAVAIAAAPLHYWVRAYYQIVTIRICYIIYLALLYRILHVVRVQLIPFLLCAHFICVDPLFGWYWRGSASSSVPCNCDMRSYNILLVSACECVCARWYIIDTIVPFRLLNL